MKKKTDREVGAAEDSAVPVVSTRATPPAADSAIEPMGIDVIRSRILTVRGVQVMLDRDLAELYGVPTKVLNQAVKRNLERFPVRFMFQLTKDEVSNLRLQIATSDTNTSLRSQIVTLNKGQGQHLKYMPYAFTEQGIAMLSAVLKSDTAVSVSIRIMDVFVAMRRTIAALAPLLARIEATERRQLKQEDAQLRNEERFKLILNAPPTTAGVRQTIAARPKSAGAVLGRVAAPSHS